MSELGEQKGPCVVCGVETAWRNPDTDAFQHLACDETKAGGGLGIQVGPWTLVGHQPHPPGECGACDEARERGHLLQNAARLTISEPVQRYTVDGDGATKRCKHGAPEPFCQWCLMGA